MQYSELKTLFKWFNNFTHFKSYFDIVGSIFAMYYVQAAFEVVALLAQPLSFQDYKYDPSCLLSFFPDMCVGDRCCCCVCGGVCSVLCMCVCVWVCGWSVSVCVLCVCTCCVCMCIVGWCACPFPNVETTCWCQVSSLITVAYILRKSLSVNLELINLMECWPVNPKGPYASASPVLGVEMHCYTSLFFYIYLDAGDLNSGPHHSCMESTLPTKPSL